MRGPIRKRAFSHQLELACKEAAGFHRLCSRGESSLWVTQFSFEGWEASPLLDSLPIFSLWLCLTFLTPFYLTLFLSISPLVFSYLPISFLPTSSVFLGSPPHLTSSSCSCSSSPLSPPPPLSHTHIQLITS